MSVAGFASFEDQVHLDHTSFIDAYIPSTHGLIEQKSLGKDLLQKIKPSDTSSSLRDATPESGIDSPLSNGGCVGDCHDSRRGLAKAFR